MGYGISHNDFELLEKNINRYIKNIKNILIIIFVIFLIYFVIRFII